MSKAILVLLLVTVPAVSYAVEEIGSMRCKNGVVKAGATKATVVARCGKPASKNPTPDQPLSMGSAPFSATEEWSYRSGNQEYVVLLNGDVVVKLFQEQRK